MAGRADLIQAFRKASEVSGWTVATQLDLVMSFISSQKLEDKFLRFVTAVQADKRELTPGEAFAGKRGLLVKYEAESAGICGLLTACGQLWVKVEGGEYQQFAWFTVKGTASKPWIPEKRSSFVSLFKQKIRDNAFTKLEAVRGQS